MVVTLDEVKTHLRIQYDEEDEYLAGLIAQAQAAAEDYCRVCFEPYMEKDEERSIVISSHISSDIEKICDDIYVINNGEIVIHDDTDTLLFEYAALKLSEEDYESLDKQYVIAVRKESYGYECLTDKKDYYMENCPDMVIEKMNLDELMLILYKGEKL